VVFIDHEQPTQRQFWTDGHEAGHALCAWHAPILRLDNEDTLFKCMHPGIEAEANYVAGYLIFQGGRFHREALKDQISMRTPLALCDQYGASRHATLRYYVEHHPYAVALLITGRYVEPDGTIPIWNSIESTEFERRFGSLQDRLPGKTIQISGGPDAPLADILLASRSSIDPGQGARRQGPGLRETGLVTRERVIPPVPGLAGRVHQHGPLRDPQLRAYQRRGGDGLPAGQGSGTAGAAIAQVAEGPPAARALECRPRRPRQRARDRQ